MGSQQTAGGLLLPARAAAELPHSSCSARVQSVHAPQQSGGLRILNWNCFRLNPTRQLDLEILLQKYSPDVAIITEVDRPSQDVSQMRFPNYTCAAPPGVHVRVLALTRDGIKIKAGPTVANLPVVSLILPDYKLSIVGIYRQHHGGARGPQRADLSSIREIVSSLSSSTDVCVAGDINLDAEKYSCIPYSTRDLYESWLELTRTNGLDLLSTGPTFKSFGKHHGHHYISTLDQVYVSETIPARAFLLSDAVTDHFPVLAELQVGGVETRHGKGLETVSKRNLASIDPAAFRAELRELGINDWPAPPPGVSVDHLIEDFYSVLNPIIDRHAPEKTFKVRRDTPCLYLSKETLEAMRMRDHARQGGGDFKMLRNKCVKLVRRDRMQTAMKKMAEASNQQAAAWRLADSVLKRGNTEKLPLLKGCKTEADCAIECNKFFLEKVEKLVNGVHTSHETKETMTNARQFIKNIAKGCPPLSSVA